MSRWVGVVLLIVAAAPLAVYPMVLVANVMQIAAFGTPQSEKLTLAETLPMVTFLVLTTAYPLAFVGATVGWWIFKRRDKSRAALAIACSPLVYLAGVGVLFFVMLQTEG